MAHVQRRFLHTWEGAVIGLLLRKIVLYFGLAEEKDDTIARSPMVGLKELPPHEVVRARAKKEFEKKLAEMRAQHASSPIVDTTIVDHPYHMAVRDFMDRYLSGPH